MFGDKGHNIRSSISMALRTGAWGALAAALATVSLALFTLALLIFLSDAYGAMTACLIVGGAYLFLAIGTFILFVSSRRRMAQHSRSLQATKASLWLEPAIVATGLEIARTLGGRRVSMLVAGAFAISWLLGHLPATAERSSVRSRNRDAR